MGEASPPAGAVWRLVEDVLPGDVVCAAGSAGRQEADRVERRLDHTGARLVDIWYRHAATCRTYDAEQLLQLREEPIGTDVDVAP